MNRFRNRAHVDAVLHPVFLFSLVALGLNDRFGKAMFPGLLTGKTSDFLGVVVFPIVLAALLSAVGAPKHAWRVGATVTVMIMVLIETSQGGADLFAGWMSTFIPTAFTADLWDLTGLLMLPLSHRVWQTGMESTAAMQNFMDQEGHRAAKPAVLVAALFLCAATSEIDEPRVPVLAPHLSVDGNVVRVLLSEFDIEGNPSGYDSVTGKQLKPQQDFVIWESKDSGTTWSKLTEPLAVPASERAYGTTCSETGGETCFSVEPDYIGAQAPPRTSLIRRDPAGEAALWSRPIDPERAKRDDQPYLTDVVQLASGDPIALMWPVGVVVNRNGTWEAHTFSGSAIVTAKTELDGREFRFLFFPAALLTAFLLPLMWKGQSGVGPHLLLWGLFAIGVVSLFGLEATDKNAWIQLGFLSYLGALAFTAASTIFALFRHRFAALAFLPGAGHAASLWLWNTWSDGASSHTTVGRLTLLILAVTHLGAFANVMFAQPKPAKPAPEWATNFTTGL